MTVASNGVETAQRRQIDVRTPQSPGWWLDYLCNRFNERDTTYDMLLNVPGLRAHLPNRRRRERLNLLWSYFIGEPPLPSVRDQFTDAFRAVLRKSRATYAPMCITSMLDRMDVIGVRTGVEDGPEGDAVAVAIMEYSNFASAFKDALTYLFTMSEAYLMVVPAAADSADRTPLITAEDPRTCIGEPDPLNPNQLRAALRLGYDPVAQREVAWLFVDGERWQASRPESSHLTAGMFGAGGFEWDGPPTTMPELAGYGGVPLVRLVNAHGMGEYEKHLDLLDRINDQILMRIVVSWYQSFRQRGVIADLEGDEDDADSPAEEIDWNDVFSADPGSLWRLPAGSQFWESAQADMTGMIAAIRDDVKEFAAVTATPLHLITPDVATQSAEGAALMREGLVFKVKDRRARVTPRLIQLWRMAFALAGESDRAKTVHLQWGAIEARSLGEKAAAVQQTRGVLSRERQLVDILEMTPEEAQQNLQELLQDQILNAQLTVPSPPQAVRLTEQVDTRVQGDGSTGAPATTPTQVP